MGPEGVPLQALADAAGDWSVTLDIFKSGGGASAAAELDVPFLGSLPFDPGIVRGGDDGVHRIVAEPDGETANSFDSIVDNILATLEAGSGPQVRIT
jgi:hypothetical protein